ncbi:MAG: gamma-glutamyltransferase [Acidobacteria bacterium]|nr:gamma-glutamyltransferase [Acidobacteriota bacterium]
MKLLFSALLLTATLLPQARREPQTRPVVLGRFHAVSSMRLEGTQVAERILHQGGNAFDAAVAGQAVLGLVDANNNGIGGDAVVLVYDAASGKVVSIDAEGTAPRLATIEWFEKHNGGKLPDSDGLLAGTVPGVIDAWYLMLDRWGTMTFAQVLAPAIDMAENGFPINDKLAGAINGSKRLRKYPSSAANYFPLPGQQTWKGGEIARFPNLARTMRRLVEAEQRASSHGRRAGLKAARDEFYKGAIAREMASFSEANGGLFRYEDFATYAARFEEPVSVDYRGYQVYKNASSNQGPAELAALNLLEGYDLKKMGHNSPDYIHTSIESIKLAFADREKYLGDTAFIRIPFEGLLSKSYADSRRALIDPRRASLEFRPGEAEKFQPGFPAVERPGNVNLSAEGGQNGDTTYIAVVDKHRNMVSFTPSLHNGFGTNVVMGDLGFSFNCRGDYFSLTRGHANALEPGKRPRSTLQSTLVMKDGKPAMILGSPGGDDQCLRTMQTFLNMAEFGMNVQRAIEAPRWSTRSFPMSYFPHRMYAGEVTVEDRIPDSIRKELISRGHKLKTGGGWSIGLNAAIVVGANGVLQAGADPRADAYALAW